jgi:hypothetical protein
MTQRHSRLETPSQVKNKRRFQRLKGDSVGKGAEKLADLGSLA